MNDLKNYFFNKLKDTFDNIFLKTRPIPTVDYCWFRLYRAVTV